MSLNLEGFESGAMRQAVHALACLVGLMVSTAAFAQEKIAIEDGVFTTQQAARGEERYRSMCSRCHGRDLRSLITEVPALTDIAFDVNWRGLTVLDLYYKIRYTMPAISRQTMPFERPDSADYLSEQLTADLVAYILAFNGFPDGSHDLEPDIDLMGRIVIPKEE